LAQLRKVRLLTAFLALLCAGATAAASDGCAPSTGGKLLHRSDELSKAELPASDYLDLMIGCNPTIGPGSRFPERPRSEWLNAEMVSYANVVARKQSDILIAPFQTQGFGLDRIERSLMTDDLAYELASKYKIADPVLVARALGEGARRIDESSILALAARIKARKIIVPFVGHDGDYTMTVSLRVLDLERGTTKIISTSEKDWRAVKFTDDSPPFQVFHSMLPKITQALDLPVDPRGKAVVRPTVPKAAALPVEPIEQLSQGGFPASRALLLLGALASADAEMPRERLLERAYAVSVRYDVPSNDATFVQAYALLGLRHRPAALAMLKDSSRPDSVALRALLNGDLPAARHAFEEITDSYVRLLLAVAVEDLRRTYGNPTAVDPDAAASLFGPAQKHWAPFVVLRLSDQDPWSAPPAAVIKALLDRAFPLRGFDLDSVAQRDQMLHGEDDPSEVTVDIANARHIRRLAEELATSDAQGSKVTQWDALWLFEDLAVSRLLKELHRVGVMQGRVAAAVRMLDEYDPFFSGDPDLAAVRAKYASGLEKKAGDDERAGWTAIAARSGLLVTYNSPGQNLAAVAGLRSFDAAEPLAANVFWDAYERDFPARDYWPLVYVGPAVGIQDAFNLYQATARQRLAYNSSNAYEIVLPEGFDVERSDLPARFVGAPGIEKFMANLKPHSRDQPDNFEDLRRRIAANPELWPNYNELGRALIKRNSDYAGAAKVFDSYPGFHTATAEDSVALSNLAYNVASIFYIHGQVDLSKPFLEISAKLQTGSNAGMTCETRLQVLAGDFTSAMQSTLERAQRYQDMYAWRDFLSLLHVTGSSEEAWKGFSQLESASELPIVWESARVGHQLAGATEADVRRWLNRPENRNARFRDALFAPWFAIAWNAVERMPPIDLPQLVRQLSGPSGLYVGEDGEFLRFHDTNVRGLQGPSILVRTMHKLPAGTAVESDLVYFAEGYTQLRHGNWKNAMDSFVGMMDRYEIDSGTDSFVLPYMAMAAAKTGDQFGLERAIDPSRDGRPMNFHRWLAKAILAGGRKDVETAAQALRKALDERPVSTNEPILTEYQYAEVCEWLYRETRDAGFMESLLQWVRSEQQIHPASAWPYAMEYAYTISGDMHRRALAMTLFLDPRSERIKAAPAHEKSEAKDWLQKNNPFVLGRLKKRSLKSANSLAIGIDEDIVKSSMFIIPNPATDSGSARRSTRNLRSYG
jgi:hypothetical protein